VNRFFLIKLLLISISCIPLHALKVYVVNDAGNSVSIFDTSTNIISGNVTDLTPATFNAPGQIAVTPDGSTAFVANQGNNSVSVIDVATDSVTQKITDASLNEPGICAITVDGSKLYVANRAGAANTICVIDVASKEVVNVISSASLSSVTCIAFAPNGKTAYATNQSNNQVAIIDVATEAVTGTVGSPNFFIPQWIAIKPDGSEAYVANTNTTVSIVDLSSNAVTGTLTGPDINGPFPITFTADGTVAYIGNNDSGTQYFLTTVDALNNTTTGKFLGNYDYMTSIVINPDPTAYVSNFLGNNISIVDLATNTTKGFVSDPNNLINGPLQLAIINPLTITGCRKTNIFLTQIDYIDVLSWKGNATAYTEYKVYLDADLTNLAGTVSAIDGTVSFEVHNRNPNVIYTYYLVGINTSGMAVSLGNGTVTTNCG